MTEDTTKPTLDDHIVVLEEPTQAEINERLNDLLARWHAHCQGYRAGKGYPSADSVCGQAKTSSVWDSWNGAEDDLANRKIMEAFDAAVWKVPRPHLIALQFQARNLASRAQVWTSPLLPKDPMERGIMLMEARNFLLRELARAGVMS